MARNVARRWRTSATLAMAGVLVVTCAACGGGSQSSALGGSCGTPGFSSNSIKLGAITSLSGVYSAAFAPFADGVRARLAVQNAEGGVDGRQLQVTAADDGSDPARNQAASQQLVEGNGVFAILEGSSFTAGGGPYLKRNNIPVIGAAISPEFQHNPNFIGYSNVTPGANAKNETSRLWGEFLKQQGGTTVYSVGSGTPAGNLAAEALMASAQAAGLTKGVLTTDLPVGTTNFTGEAQKAKSANVDTLALVTPPTPSASALQALKQAGVNVKASVLMTGYDPAQAPAGLAGLYFFVPFAPLELNLPVQQQYVAAMKKYTSTDPLSGYLGETGWISADLMITALQKAGKCPTRQGLLDTIHSIKGYTADGFIQPTDFTPALHGAPTSCAYFATVKDGKWIVANGGKPFCASDPTPLKY